MTWIRVEGDAGDDIKWEILGKKCGIDADCAFGKVVRLWGRVIDQQEDGDLSGVPDAKIEDWAHWQGKAGRFAKAFRELCTSRGSIKGWDDHQGKLIRRRRADRVRKESGNRPDIQPEAA